MSYTRGEWIQEDDFIYALTHAGWRKGEEVFKNRFFASIQVDKDAPKEEAIANARLISAAPDLLEQLQESTNMLIRIVESQDWGAIEDQIKDNQQAIEKALGSQS